MIHYPIETTSELKIVMSSKLAFFEMTAKSALELNNSVVQYLYELKAYKLINLSLWFYDKYEFNYRTERALLDKVAVIPFNEKALENIKILTIEDHCINLNRELSKLPKEISLLKNLEVLVLKHANIVSLQTGLQKLQKLISLDLSFNKIGRFNQNIFELPNLEHINLENNNIYNLSRKIMMMKNLGYLNLLGNNMIFIPLEVLEWLKDRMDRGITMLILPNEYRVTSQVYEDEYLKNHVTCYKDGYITHDFTY